MMHCYGYNGMYFSRKEQLDMLADQRGMVTSSSNKNVSFSHNFEENRISHFRDFVNFIDDARNSNETFKYWDTFIYLMQQAENLVRADRDGDWALHLQAVQVMLLCSLRLNTLSEVVLFVSGGHVQASRHTTRSTSGLHTW